VLNVSSATPQPATRDRLVQAAIELIANEGAQAATVRRVADAVGVSAPLVLHHFGSKEGLVAACDERVLATMEGMLAEMAASGADAGFQYLMADEQAAVLLLYVAAPSTRTAPRGASGSTGSTRSPATAWPRWPRAAWCAPSTTR